MNAKLEGLNREIGSLRTIVDGRWKDLPDDHHREPLLSLSAAPPGIWLGLMLQIPPGSTSPVATRAME